MLMNLETTTEKTKGVMNSTEDLPCISLIIPFEPKMKRKNDLDSAITVAVAQAEKDLMKNYPEEKALPVIKKLRRLIKNFNYAGRNKSIAIFVSPQIEKIYYFNYDFSMNAKNN